MIRIRRLPTCAPPVDREGVEQVQAILRGMAAAIHHGFLARSRGSER